MRDSNPANLFYFSTISENLSTSLSITGYLRWSGNLDVKKGRLKAGVISSLDFIKLKGINYSQHKILSKFSSSNILIKFSLSFKWKYDLSLGNVSFISFKIAGIEET